MFDEVVRHHSISVQLGAFAIGYTVRTIRVRHEIKLPVVLYELINQSLGTLVVDVIVTGSMNQQKLALQL